MAAQLKEIADRVITVIKDYVTHAVNARAASLEARADKLTVQLESAERRLSRHAEHLARLESRLKALE